MSAPEPSGVAAPLRFAPSEQSICAATNGEYNIIEVSWNEVSWG
jgi:hypothetical protein